VSHKITVGCNLDDRFRITEVIRQSGMNTIYKAIDTTNGTFVAIKVPLLQFESDPAYFSRFQREEQIGKKLNHPGIIKIIPAENKSRPYMVMEYLEGHTLRRVLADEGPLAAPRALEIAAYLSEILDYMHAHDVVHRDLKPGNIVVCDDGGLRIIDFGIARDVAMRRMTFGWFSPTSGSPRYMAPEQIKGKRGDARTDIYSLGAILYEMVAGIPPFDGKNLYELMNARLTTDPRPPHEINREVTPQIEEIILRAMEREPSDRYSSAAAMKRALDDPQSILTAGQSRRRNPPRLWMVKAERAAFMLAVAATPVVAFFLFLLMFQHQAAAHLKP
jgi:serine/threonine protein kinase